MIMYGIYSNYLDSNLVLNVFCLAKIQKTIIVAQNNEVFFLI
ncbi:hypothetical protein EZS27_031289 [termite gut metagenome]|uniref:Uncharacterized protein n=1 Tax=termite gut metagenome TaxID=433724 RepID=A0A5J4QD99_9ZZZZ